MLRKIALKMFGDIIEPYIDYFEGLKTNLKKGLMNYTLHDYICLILFASLMTFIASLITLSALLTIVITPAPTALIYAYTTAFILSLVCTAGAFFLGYYYPSIKASSLKGKIERSLPFAVFYMTTSASSGINPVDTFRLLGERGGVIGNEAKRIYSDVTTLGLSLTDAIQRAALRTPSPLFSDLLYGISSIITSGGNIESYLKGKTKTFMAQYKRNLEEYSDTISLYNEIYLTAVIVGSLLFTVLVSIISPFAGGNILFMQTFIIFFAVPLISVAYIFLLRSTSPT